MHRALVREQDETLCCFLTYIKQTFHEVKVLYATLIIPLSILEVRRVTGQIRE